jgi:hypothetical protein
MTSVVKEKVKERILMARQEYSILKEDMKDDEYGWSQSLVLTGLQATNGGVWVWGFICGPGNDQSGETPRRRRRGGDFRKHRGPEGDGLLPSGRGTGRYGAVVGVVENESRGCDGA